MAIKFIYFDQGEVLFTNDWEFYSPQKDKAFYSHYKITKEQFSISRKKFIEKLFRGRISEKDYWRNVLKDADSPDVNPDKAIYLARKYQSFKPGMRALLKKLEKSNVPMGIISTTHKEMWRYKIRRFKIKRYFGNNIFTSFETGYIKPEKQIYLQAVKEVNIKPEEILFIDDTPKNVEGAIAVGMKGILFENVEKLMFDLKKLNIL